MHIGQSMHDTRLTPSRQTECTYYRVPPKRTGYNTLLNTQQHGRGERHTDTERHTPLNQHHFECIQFNQSRSLLLDPRGERSCTSSCVALLRDLDLRVTDSQQNSSTRCSCVTLVTMAGVGGGGGGADEAHMGVKDDSAVSEAVARLSVCSGSCGCRGGTRCRGCAHLFEGLPCTCKWAAAQRTEVAGLNPCAGEPVPRCE